MAVFMRKSNSLDVWSEEEVEAVYQAVLNILSELSVRFQRERTPELFAEKGYEVDFQRRIVNFPPLLIEDCLGKVPSSFHFRARDTKHNLMVGGGRLYFARSVGIRVVDLDAAERHSPTLKTSQLNEGLKGNPCFGALSTSSSFSPFFKNPSTGVSGIAVGKAITVGEVMQIEKVPAAPARGESVISKPRWE